MLPSMRRVQLVRCISKSLLYTQVFYYAKQTFRPLEPIQIQTELSKTRREKILRIRERTPEQKRYDTINMNKNMKKMCVSGDVLQAAEIFVKHLELQDVNPDVISFNTIFTHLAKHGYMKIALEIFGMMKKAKVDPDASTFEILIAGFFKYDMKTELENFLELMYFHNFTPSVRLLTNIVYQYTMKGELEKARKLFDDIPREQRTNLTYNPLIQAYANEGRFKEATDLIIEMFRIGLTSRGGAPFTYLINGYLKAQKYKEAVGVLDLMQEYMVEPLAILIRELVEALASENQLDLMFDVMKREEVGMSPKLCCLAMKKCFESKNPNGVMRIYNEMIETKTPVDEHIYSTMINGYIELGLMDETMKIVEVMSEHFTPTIVIYNNLIKGFLKMKDYANAIKVFEELLASNMKLQIITFTSIVPAYVHTGQQEKALELLDIMKTYNIEPDMIFYTSLISVLCSSGDLKSAKDLYLEMQDKGFKPDVVVLNIMIRHIGEALGLAEAMRFYRDMKKFGVQPNRETYRGLFNSVKPGKDVALLVEQMKMDEVVPDLSLEKEIIRLQALSV